MWLYLTQLNCTLKYGEDGKFYVMCILPRLKIKVKKLKKYFPSQVFGSLLSFSGPWWKVLADGRGWS